MNKEKPLLQPAAIKLNETKKMWQTLSVSTFNFTTTLIKYQQNFKGVLNGN